MWTCEVLLPWIDILNDLIPMWHVAQSSSIFSHLRFVSHFLDLVCDGLSRYGFPKYVCIYVFRKSIASNYSLELLGIITWILKVSRISSYLSIVFNPYPMPNAYLSWIWSLISFLYTTEKYLQSTPCPWQVILILVVEFLDHLHFWLLLWITCFYCQTCFIKLLLSSLYLFGLWCALPKFVLCFIGLEKQWSHSCAFTFKSHTSLQCTILGEAILLCVEHHSLIWYCIFLPFLNMTSVWTIHGEWWSNLCAFVFKCKITNNAHILVKLLYVFEH